MFDRVLVPLDESALAEQALPHAVAVARLTGALVTLVRVLEPPTSAGVEQPTDPVEWQLALDGAHSYLARVQRSLADVGVTAAVEVVEGEPATSILQHMHDTNTDLLALTTHGRGGMLGHSLGSVASKVLLRTRINVLLVRSLHAARGVILALPQLPSYATVLVPLDGSLRAEAAVSVAVRLCDNTAAVLLVPHVIEDGKPIGRKIPDDVELGIRSTYRQARCDAAQAYLASLTKELGNGTRSVDVNVVSDEDTLTAIDRLTSERAIDLTVMTAHGETGSSRWPYGSVALHTIVYGGTTLLVIQDRDRQELQQIRTERAARERQGHG